MKRTYPGIFKPALQPNRNTRPKSRTVNSEQPEDSCENHQDTLTDNQWHAIASLLEGHTLQATADTCAVNVRTLRRWLHTSDFAEEYNRARRQHLDNVAASLQTAAQDAAATLMRLLKCGDPLIELRAAKTILQISQKSVESAEVQKRLHDLEKTNAHLADQIQKLESANKSLQQSKEEYVAMSHSLITGAFQRPDWITASAWDKIVRNNQRTAVPT